MIRWLNSMLNGKISKQILDRINQKIITTLHLNQWKNTNDVVQWFNNINDKNEHSFIEFDVVDFYPTISIELLNNALDFATSYVNITDDKRQIVIHAKKSFLLTMKNSGPKKHLTTISTLP